MIRKILATLLTLCLMILFLSCSTGKETSMTFTGAKGEVKLMTLDPGHFHAALVQKTMYEQVDSLVHIYAPEGSDVEDHINRINGFNTRTENPTAWKLTVYRGDDFFDRMLTEKPGNVMITAGNNRNKTQYIKAAVDASINVLADKPMCINKSGFEMLKEAFASAAAHDVLLYDIMTERYEITTLLQKKLAHMTEVFGELVEGSPEQPAVTKESVHHFFKYVSGNPIKRPAWYFDTTQQGEGIVDVATHLVDLIQWECFPEKILDSTDVKMLSAKRWVTEINRAQFERVTDLPEFPDFLQPNVRDGVLSVYSNGEFVYQLKGIHAKVSVIWNYEAPAGGGDTHFSIMRGSKANVVIRQGKEQNYRAELYVEPVVDDPQFSATLADAIKQIAQEFPGVDLEQAGNSWHISIPEKYRVGHEAHFGQVTQKYLQFLIDGELPEWEVPNMITKYYTTTSALEFALQGSN
ncbi:oxidoreductase [candidate division KSB1 bacterium]|nr:oxidoreductase [candidate division KSB1 bacterium]